MNTQKIRMSTKSTRGFTLVELIVVITILVILGTIAFLNMGSFSASARDSQRTSDLNQINQQIMTIQAKQGMSYMNMLSGTTANTIAAATIKIGGTGAINPTEYNAGDVNYTALGIDNTKFDDPTKSVAYKMGATTLAGTAYELAASLEETNKALVMGVYRPRATEVITGTGVSDVITILPADIGKLRVGDTITTAGVVVTTTIKSISADGLRITLAATADGATSLTLPNSETNGLIAEYGVPATPVTNEGADLPYVIQ